MTSLHPINRTYDIIGYDPQWPLRFEEYARTLKEIFGDVVVEHIGSTSVPGMAGKSIIDILVIVDDLGVVKTKVPEMERAGFVDFGQAIMEYSRLFRDMEDKVPCANIHLFPTRHPHTREMISLRDYLRAHSKEVEAYSSLKRALHEQYAGDYMSYRKHKDAYMHALQQRANRWAAQ